MGAIAMKIRLMAAAAALLALLAMTFAVEAAEVRALFSNAVKSVTDELAPQFEKASGHRLLLVYGSTNPLKAQIDKGEPFDLTILGDSAIDELIKQGKLAGATRTIVARSGIGVVIRKGAPKPDIGTKEAFTRAFVNAKSIAYSSQGLSGAYLKDLFQRLGIADTLRPKTKDARAAESIAAGEAEIGATQISEILPVAGAQLAGPLPAEIQKYFVFVAAISSGSKQVDAANAVLKFLLSSKAVETIKANGLEPPE
jgi:molybdate transport system substrate-binding protein